MTLDQFRDFLVQRMTSSKVVDDYVRDYKRNEKLFENMGIAPTTERQWSMNFMIWCSTRISKINVMEEVIESKAGSEQPN